MITALLLGIGFTESADAQVRMNVNVNIGQQPEWGPRGYDYAEYYYMPDMDAYYYVPQKQFIYLSGGHWVRAYNPPPRYRNVNLYTVNKIVINEPRPYLKHTYYRTKYVPQRDRVVVREVREQRNHYYNGNRGNGKWKENKGNNGHGRGHDKGRGHGHDGHR